MLRYLRNVVLGICLGLAFGMVLGSVRGAKAQEHHSGHPPQDMAIHEKFYSTWQMPDNRALSCCHLQDCSPAESKYENGQWLARKVGDVGGFTPIPPRKIEQERDSPDGRSHLCGQRYGAGDGDFGVYCFIAGSGT